MNPKVQQIHAHKFQNDFCDTLKSVAVPWMAK